MPVEQNRRTTRFDEDSYSANRIKTLEDLFKVEEGLITKISDLESRLRNENSKQKKKELKKELVDAERLYANLYTKERNAAVKAIEDQQKARTKAQIKEYQEYEALLDKQVKAGITSEKNKEKQLKKLRDATDKENKAREARDASRGRREARAAREDLLDASKEVWGGAGGWKNSGQQMMASLSHSLEHGLKQVGKAFADISNKINSAMDAYSKYQSAIDTRLQESGKNFTAMQDSLKRAVGASPYLKTETMLNNLQSLVEAGIVTNVEQRAFLNTIKDKVAATFDAANGSLLRIIRLQQNDSTAARLGMEAYLTRFLNVMVENTEYLTSTFDSVQEALVEASSIMNTAASTEFEYIVQKWLGTLVGRGMSESTATGLAGALGMLGSGNVTGLSGNALNNLLVMAASRAGLDYSTLLTGGLDASTTNALMKSIVKYMQEIGSSSSNVVRSQYAQTFGLSVSDLVAAMGVGNQVNEISNNFMSYEGMYDELAYQLDQVSSRTHISEKLANLFDNAQFSLASNIAGNAVTAAMWKVTDMIQGVTGGINIPMISVMGSAIDLETTVENLMKLGLVGVGSFGMMADVIQGLSQSGSGFSRVLNSLKINSGTANYRGTSTGRGLQARNKGLTTSLTSDLIVNAAGEDIQEQTLNATMDEQKSKQAEAAKEEDNPMGDVRDYLLTIFDSKFNSLLAMTARTSGFSSVSIPKEFVIGDKSIVKAEYKVDDKVSSNLDILNKVEQHTADILDILANRTLNVNVENISELRVLGSSTL